MKNLFATAPVLLYSEKVTVWCWLTASFIVWPLFFEEMCPAGIVNGIRYENRVSNAAFPTLQQHPCMDRIIFILVDPIPKSVRQLLKRHIGND